MGVALSQTVLARREQFHQSRLVEHLGSWNPFYNDTLGRIQGYLNGRAATGSSSGTSMAIINQIVQTQATLLAYIDVFVTLGVIAMVMVPLALTLRGVIRNPCEIRAVAGPRHLQRPIRLCFAGTLTSAPNPVRHRPGGLAAISSPRLPR